MIHILELISKTNNVSTGVHVCVKVSKVSELFCFISGSHMWDELKGSKPFIGG